MFLKQLSAAFCVSVVFGGQFAHAQELKLADFQPPSHFVAEKGYKPFAQTITDKTNGEVTVTVYMGGELGAGPAEQYSRALDGVADIAFGLPGYTATNFPKTLLSELPGVIAAETGTQAMQNARDLLADEYRRVVLLGLWNNAPNLVMTANKPVKSLSDLKGLKMRVPSRNAGLVVEAWGGVPVSMPASEVYNALQTGVLDGAMIDASALGGFKLSEVINHITLGMDTTISNFFVVMNHDSFDKLSPQNQTVVLEAGQQLALDGNAAWLEVSQKALDSFGATAGKEIIVLSPEEAAGFNALSAPVVEKVIADLDATGVDASGYVKALKAQ